MDQEEATTMSLDACDESKCVSRGRSDLFDGSFTCYGDDDIFPMMCADGFLPVIVNNEATFEVDISGKFDVTLNYFTCCPPNEATELTSEDSTRQCSDPIAADDYETAELLCYDRETQRYPHPIKSIPDDEIYFNLTFYKCCDFINDNGNNTDTAIDFLDETECVPYRDENYKAAMVKNNIGTLRPRVCKLLDYSVPRAIGEGTAANSLGEYQYQCCRDGDALEPFVPDSAFYVTLYPLLILYCFAAIISIIVILGLLIPLFKQIKNGTYAMASRVSQSSRRREKPYSTYNLYLVHLAILDLMYCFFQVVRFSSAANQQVYPRFYSWIMESEFSGRQSMTPYFLISTGYGLANMWINAVICYEIMALLNSSKQHIKRASPTLTKVNLEAGSVVLLLLIIAISFHYTNDYSGLDIEDSLIKCLSAMAYIPFFYVVYVSFRVRRFVKSLGDSSARDFGMRQLAIYFMRIVGVYIVVWIPNTLILLLLYFGANLGYWAILVVFALMAIQPILTFMVILTKEDANNYIVDLLTFKYCRKQHRASVFNTTSSTTTKGKSSSTPATLGYSSSVTTNRDTSFIGAPVSGDYSSSRDTSYVGKISFHFEGSSTINEATGEESSTLNVPTGRDVTTGRDKCVSICENTAVPREDEETDGML